MIRNIVYDVGYVLIGYTWRDGFRRLGYDDAGADRMGEKIFATRDPGDQRTWWEKYDVGEVTGRQIEEAYRLRYPEDRKALDWFFANPSAYAEYLTDLTDTIPRMRKKGFRIFLLSNYPKEIWESHVKAAPFRNQLDGAVVSWQEGFGKPEQRFYQVLLDRYHLRADECLFLDDRADNTKAAAQAGLHTITLDSGDRRKEAVRYLDSLPEPAPATGREGQAC